MNIIAPTKALTDAFTRASKAVRRTSPLPSLGCILLALDGDDLILTATDLDINAVTWVEGVGVASSDDGSAVLVPATLGRNALRAWREPTIHLWTDEDEVHLGNTSLHAGKLADWPKQAIDPFAFTFTREVGPAFASSLAGVLPAASRDDARPVLCGVCVEAEEGKAVLVATDSYRLACAETETPLSDTLGILPLRMMRLVPAVTGPPSLLQWSDQPRRSIAIAGDRGLVWAYAVEGSFPRWRPLMPAGEGLSFSVDATQMLAELRPHLSVAADHIPIRCQLEGGNLDLTTIRQDAGTVTSHLAAVSIDYETEVTVAFNGAYLADGFKALGPGEVTVHFYDPLKPALLCRGELRYLLMPVRL